MLATLTDSNWNIRLLQRHIQNILLSLHL